VSNSLSLAQRLSELWSRGQRPDVGQFLAGAGALTLGQMAAVLWIDQRERWGRGEAVGGSEVKVYEAEAPETGLMPPPAATPPPQTR
jgi:hypothetical protein